MCEISIALCFIVPAYSFEESSFINVGNLSGTGRCYLVFLFNYFAYVQFLALCSLSRQAAPLENMMRENLSSKHPKAYEWFWSKQVPSVVTSFVNYIEGDQRFVAATSVYIFSFKSPSFWLNALTLLVNTVKH